MNLATNLERSAFYFRQRPAVVDGPLEVTYGQFNEDANRAATALMKIGVAPGDYVGLYAPNSYHWLVFSMVFSKRAVLRFAFLLCSKRTN